MKRWMKFVFITAAVAAAVLALTFNVLQLVLQVLLNSTSRTDLSTWLLAQTVKSSLPPESIGLLLFVAVAAVLGFTLDAL